MAFGIVLLREHPHWQAPASFSEGLTKSLATQIGEQALLVRIADSKADSGEPQELGQQAFVTDWTAICRWISYSPAGKRIPCGAVDAPSLFRIF